MRLFRFDSGIEKDLAMLHETRALVRLANCAAQKMRDGRKFELMMRDKTEVKPMDEKQFAVESSGPAGKLAKLDKTETMQEYERLTVIVKIVHVDEAMEVSGGRKK